MWQRFKLWLTEWITDLFDIKKPDISQKIVIVLLRVIGIFILLFVIYKIVKLILNDDGNWIFGRKSDSVKLHISNIEQDIHNTDYFVKVTEALQNNNYRLAIRYYYLLSLKRLSEKGKINWDSEKTNYDYYQEIKETELKKQFQYISYIYDYCWYGEFDIDKNEYDTSEKAFKNLMNLI